MIDPAILERQILILAVKNADLRMALEEIDAVAVGKRTGAAKKMQAIARKALFPPREDPPVGYCTCGRHRDDQCDQCVALSSNHRGTE